MEHSLKEKIVNLAIEDEELEPKSTPVLSEKDIMEMDAVSRAYILSPKNRDKYSEQQQAVIDAINKKGQEAHGKDWYTKLEDIARLQQARDKDQIMLNKIMLDTKVLTNYVNEAKIARLKRDRTKRYEPLFKEAELAMRNLNEDDDNSVAARDAAMTKLAEFINEPSQDSITDMVKRELQEKYKNSEAMQALDEHDALLDQMYADILGVTTLTDEEEQSLDGQPIADISDQGGLYMGPTKMVMTERELTDNDRALLSYALAYASSHMIPIDKLSDAVNTQDFADYVHKMDGLADREDNPVIYDPQDARKLVHAAVNTYNKFEEARQKDRARQKRKPVLKLQQV